MQKRSTCFGVIFICFESSIRNSLALIFWSEFEFFRIVRRRAWSAPLSFSMQEIKEMLDRQIGARPFILISGSVINLQYKHLESWTFNRAWSLTPCIYCLFKSHCFKHKVLVRNDIYCVLNCSRTFKEGFCKSILSHAKIIHWLQDGLNQWWPRSECRVFSLSMMVSIACRYGQSSR